MITKNSTIYLLAKKHIIRRRQFILYILIGLSGVIIDYAAYSAGVKLLSLGVLVVNLFSVSLGIINNFYWNVKYNFKVRDRLLLRFSMFYSVGLIGLVLSELLLAIFHYEFKIDPLLAKLLTLPFVLVSQYALNKYVSFGSIKNFQEFLHKVFRHWPVIVLVIVFTICSLMFVKYIPSNFSTNSLAGAPDEGAHYTYNVEFILEHKRLPISGKDDLAAYKNCRNNPTAEVPCMYSYTFYPGASYIINAISASLVSKITGIEPQVASRLPSTLYGVTFILCIYATAYIISKRRLVAALLAAGVGLIPQYIFISSYTNLDAHSVAISGILSLALVLYASEPKRYRNIAFLGIAAGGLLPLAKYDFFVLIIPVVLLVAYLLFKKKINNHDLFHLGIWGVGSFIVLASFWYIRNLILYHDISGQGFALKEMSKFHALGKPLPIDLASFAHLTTINFWEILFRSFYLAYGEMIYFLDDSRYVVPAIFGVAGLVYIFVRISELNKKRRKVLIWATIAFLALLILVVAQVVYNSLIYDFQPQGRYLFPILAPLVIFVAYCAKVDKQLGKNLSLLLATSTLFIFINGVLLFIKVYLNA
jgi:putative flippase GtrA